MDLSNKDTPLSDFVVGVDTGSGADEGIGFDSGITEGVGLGSDTGSGVAVDSGVGKGDCALSGVGDGSVVASDVVTGLTVVADSAPLCPDALLSFPHADNVTAIVIINITDNKNMFFFLNFKRISPLRHDVMPNKSCI